MLIVKRVTIGLDYDPTDLAWPEARTTFLDISRRLETAGLSPKNLVHARRGTVMASFILLGPYVVPITQIVIPTLALILVAWLKGPDRRVRVKVGEAVIDATHFDDFEWLFAQLQEFHSKARRWKPPS